MSLRATETKAKRYNIISFSFFYINSSNVNELTNLPIIITFFIKLMVKLKGGILYTINNSAILIVLHKITTLYFFYQFLYYCGNCIIINMEMDTIITLKTNNYIYW
jgi:hypothetical protein